MIHATHPEPRAHYAPCVNGSICGDQAHCPPRLDPILTETDCPTSCPYCIDPHGPRTIDRPTVTADRVQRAAEAMREHWEEDDAEGPVDCRCGGFNGPESMDFHRLTVALADLGIEVRP